MYRKVTLLVMAALLVSLLAAAPAGAQEWIQHPMVDTWWWCDYYYDGGPYEGYTYWCYAPDAATGEYGWVRAKPGWQYGPLGG
jgi:hypothetical protein